MIGLQLGSYRIVDKIGEGGMGAVYLAEHVTLGRRAAIKVLLPERAVNPDLVNRFFHEAKTTAMLQHPNLVDIYDFGNHDGHAFIVMEYLVGESLAVRMHREGPMPLAMIYTIARQIALALHVAHARNIMHRDLKPENVYLVYDTEAPFHSRVKVLDFGLAKLQGDMSALSMTRTGALLGTPLYMSPEQCRGIKEIDWRTDIYALGCLLYEMTTGEPPFVREAIGDLMVAHMQEPPASPRIAAPHAPPDLERLILACLAKRPSDRIQSMSEIAVVLDRLLATTSGVVIPGRISSPMLGSTSNITGPTATPASTTLASANGQVSPQRSSSSRRALVIGATAAVVIGIAVAAISLSGGSVEPATKPTVAAVDPGSAKVETEPAKVDPPKVDPPKVDPPKVDPPKVDPPKVDPAKPTVATIELTVTSTPAGAEIRRKSDNKLLGTTPATLTLDQSDQKLQVVAKRTGYRSDPFTLDVSKPGKIDLKLRPATRTPSTEGSGGVKDGAYDPFAPQKGSK